MKSFPKNLKAAALSKTDISWTGEVTFQAGERDGDNPKLPTVNLLAYTGGPMKPSDWNGETVIVDLAGASFLKRVSPIIGEHSGKSRIGHTDYQAIVASGKTVNLGGKPIQGPAIVAHGPISSQSIEAQEFTGDAARGFPFEVSIGARIKRAERLEAGATAVVNGIKVKGPMTIARQTVIREFSICTFGADSDTSATLAAQEGTMTFAEYLKLVGIAIEASELEEDQVTALNAGWQAHLKASEVPAKGKGKGKSKKKVVIEASEDEDDDSDIDDGTTSLRATAAAEVKRHGQLNARMAMFPNVETLTLTGEKTPITKTDLLAKAIEEGWDGDRLELSMRRADYPTPSKGPSIHAVDRTLDGKALECALLRYSGMEEIGVNAVNGRKFGIAAYYDDKTMEASHGKQYRIGGSIQALLDLQIRAAGDYYPSTDRGSSDFVAQAIESWKKSKLHAASSGFSIINVVQILENTMHKEALSSFNAQETIWRFLAGRRPLNDFKTHYQYRLDFSGHFRKVAMDGQLKHVGMTDSKYSIAADTYGAMIAIDRKTIKNDDLGLALAKARGIGMLGAMRIEESVFVLLLSNPSSFFHANNSNLITGGGTVLGLAGLETARVSFRNQVVNGKPVGVSPSILLVGTTLETTANRLYREDNMAITTTADAAQFSDNPNKGLYKPYVSGYLNNTGITDQDGAAISGQSATQWYLMAPPTTPQGSAIVIGFVDGRDEPYFDQAETDFNVPGGIQFRSYLDWGVGMNVTQLALRSAGA